jgi:3-oxoisoapionate decarboxylase
VFPGTFPLNPWMRAGLLVKAGELGVRLIQIADNLPLDRMDDNRIRELVAVAAASGIVLEAGSNMMTR